MPKFIMEEPVSIRTARGDLITGVLRIQTKRSQKKQEYGFDLYKNKRIITSFSKIGLGMHGEKALICGEFDFDFCPVNFTKNDFLRESENYKAAENAIKQYLRPLIPLFTTKNLNKEKVEKMLKIKEKSGKTPNLREYKELIKSLDNDEEVLISETVYINDAIGKSEVMNEEPARISKHTELLSQIGSHLNHIEETSKLIEECRKDKESINEINNNSMTEMKLSSYSDSLIDLANKIQLLLGKANLQQLASDSGINTANISI